MRDGASPFEAVIDAVLAEAVDCPIALVAFAEKLYEPSLRPEIWHVVSGALTVHVAPPGEAVTV